MQEILVDKTLGIETVEEGLQAYNKYVCLLK
jgi:hypothetical protein